jgi:serine protease Do
VRVRLSRLLAGAALGLPLTAPAADPTPRRDELVLVVDRVKAAVVDIHSERLSGGDDPFRSGPLERQRVNGMGTGIVLDPRGYVVTNYHVIDDVQSLRVRLDDGTTCPARVLAADKESDLAVIKIDPPRPLPTAVLGTATDLMLAERVIAIGNAYGYEHTVTVGHVSALKRDVPLNKEVNYKSLIQTQTPINPGNSGGPLFNKLGEVVGVNVAIRSGAQNIAFAIPVDTMIGKAADMLSVRRRHAVRHGLTVADRLARPADDAPVRRWAVVTAVEPDSPAAAAGLKPGDVLKQVNDLAVNTSIDVERALWDTVGRPVAVKLGRDAADTEVSLTLSGPLSAGDVVARRLGGQLYPVPAGSVTQADRQLRGGLMVQHVTAGGPLARAGVQRGDVLIGLHQWEAISLDNVTYVLGHRELATFNPMKAYYLRAGRVLETTVRVD